MPEERSQSGPGATLSGNGRAWGVQAWFRAYTFIDYATQIYVALVGLMILFRHNASVPQWRWLLAGHVLCLVCLHGLIRLHAGHSQNRVLDLLRHFYPILLFTAFYTETGSLNRLWCPEYLDPYFIRLEQAWLEGQPSLLFMERCPYLLVSEVFYASYFSYYLMIFGVGLALFLSGRERFQHYVSTVSFVFYVCYLIYIFLPVIGPRVFYKELGGLDLPPDLSAIPAPDFPQAVQGGPFFQVMALIYRHFETPGAAFPSSHVAVAFCTVYFSFLYLRPIRYFHLLVAILLSLATVYCRYHYVIDVLAGVVTALLLVPLGNRLYGRFGSGRSSGPSGVGDSCGRR